MSSIRNRYFFRASLIYFGVTLFSVLFTVIYYAVDHGLRDLRMTLLFLPPLIVSVLFLVLSVTVREKRFRWWIFFHMGFPAIYLHELLSAIIAMANARNDYVVILLFLGIGLMALFLLLTVIDLFRERKKREY